MIRNCWPGCSLHCLNIIRSQRLYVDPEDRQLNCFMRGSPKSSHRLVLGNWNEVDCLGMFYIWEVASNIFYVLIFCNVFMFLFSWYIFSKTVFLLKLIKKTRQKLDVFGGAWVSLQEPTVTFYWLWKYSIIAHHWIIQIIPSFIWKCWYHNAHLPQFDWGKLHWSSSSPKESLFAIMK